MEKKAFIEKLVVEGFKSYGEKKREIPIGEGFVAIVGPNGAGKSNIGDAIAFALGLSTAKTLRAKNLSYLIFSKNGRKAPHAYVEVHFRNLGAFPVDSEEVVISRKVTGEGRSVFKINGVAVRERDLKDFLTKAGIYENAYNVVYQGDIVRFLKHTPLERRRIIEEVAGIGEYERKKEKALQDLGEVELKIREIKLILEEIKVQLDRLAEEKKKLDLYRKFEREKRELELKILLKEKAKLLREKEKLLAEVKSLEENLRTLKEELKEREKELLRKEEELKEVNESIMPYKEKIGKLISDLQHAEGKLKEKEKELESLINREKQLQELVEDLKRDKKKLEKEVSEMEKRLAEKKEEYIKLKEEEEKKLKELEEEEERLKVTLEEVKRLEEEKKYLSEKIDLLKTKKGELEVKVKELSLKIRKTLEEIEKLREEKRTKLEELKEKKKELEKLKTIKAQEEKELRKLNESLKAYERQVSLIRKELEEVIKEKGAVEREVSEKISAVDVFGDIRGVYGTVAQLIKVKDPDHITAIEVAGGGRLKYLVVEDEEIAKKCIEKAKKLGLGRYSFIPLNRIRAEAKPLRYPRVRGAVDFAVNLIEYDPKFEKVILFVFGDTLIVEDFESARRIGIGSYRMVTLDGELFEKSGVITGGNLRSSGELSARYLEEKVKELEEKEKKLKEEEERLYKRIKELRSLVSEKFALLKVIDKKLEEHLHLSSEETEKQYEEKLKRAEDYVKILEEEKTKREKEILKIKEELDYLLAKLENLKLKERDVSRYYASVGLEEKRRKYSALRKKATELYNLLKETEGELNRKKMELEYLIKEIEQKEREIHYLKQKIGETLKDIENLKTVKEELSQEIKRTEENVYELFRIKEELEREIGLLKSELGAKKLKEEELASRFGSLERSLGVLEEKLKVIEEEEKNYEDLSVKEPTESLHRLKEKLNEVIRKLEGLGSVNFLADEDYAKELERFKEFEDKHEQLKKESKAIREMIEEIEKKKKKVFMEAFKNINKNLGRIFSFLSPGGKAKMILENEEEPFEGGIQLTVKPRGKDVQYLEAMSGGEKTLAALSLIFAIQEYKPSPFYYFDEVDAHLDEANAKKVGELIREKSRKAQFIVVTLREVLSSLADKVIGVTARGGVSETFFLKNEVLEEAS